MNVILLLQKPKISKYNRYILTNSVNANFIGLTAVLTDEQLEKEVHIINMMQILGLDYAEVMKSAVEAMVYRFDFDKSRILGTEF